MTDGTQKEGHFSGKLYLKGIGDPILSADNYDKIANNLAALGIRKIDGNLVLDDTSFDSIALGPGWMIDDEDKYFEAQISALTFSPNADFNAGTVIIDVSATRTGNSTPGNNVVKVINSVVNGNASAVIVTRARGSNDIYVSGYSKGWRFDTKIVWRINAFFLIVSDTFQTMLRRYGIKVADHTVVGGPHQYRHCCTS
ncbi:D-alanyl-D-alanine carboxypeptidase [Xylella fastidiosa]|nr:D-alanyl-D-alanine carboxypeptidase [Xylella fastidiosa]MRT34544.1 penicillin-binding protein [Xylella fastidiosa subsp. multiplex]MRT46202.1 penicillin-binding protein [Xylella fastidiosa subsp. multiplex]MRT96399.1 penicillin-binding protein [Xylella fastidiosa subsp. multiplex]MRU28887.1 penicillin-binding protein [Xylella fastidiosa subsp. multiplex]MRU31236.1 penicillin-binding protein [Xylella fastidiosa subsp. multiplex]